LLDRPKPTAGCSANGSRRRMLATLHRRKTQIILLILHIIFRMYTLRFYTELCFVNLIQGMSKNPSNELPGWVIRIQNKEKFYINLDTVGRVTVFIWAVMSATLHRRKIQIILLILHIIFRMYTL
jgi:hypothetical protein